MFDTIYEFIEDYLIGSTMHGGHLYLTDITVILTHVSIWLIYIVLIMLLVHVFNAFRSMTRWW
jgi:hypothetical protein